MPYAAAASASVAATSSLFFVGQTLKPPALIRFRRHGSTEASSSCARFPRLVPVRAAVAIEKEIPENERPETFLREVDGSHSASASASASASTSSSIPSIRFDEALPDLLVKERNRAMDNFDPAIGSLENGEDHTAFAAPIKVIIDTDPGIDDSMTILMAFQKSEIEVLGLTTIFGNVSTEDATRNALLLCEIAGHPEVPVAEGSHEPLKGGKPRAADFVHGSDGFGNLFLPPPAGKKIEESASEFLVDKVSQYPDEVSILALGPLTNLALAIKRDSSFASKVKKIVILGGAFFAAGNVNPAAEANIFGDPEAADVVFTCGADITVVGINITTQVKFSDADLAKIRNSKGKHSHILCEMCMFYRDWHVKSDGVYGIFLHDPVSFTALVRPDLFTYKKGVVRVETLGICAGHTLMDQGLKKWNTSNPWTGYSPVSVAWTVDVPRVLSFIRELLVKP